MKKVIFCALLGSLVLISCRKKIERDVDLASNAGPLHCQDNLFNEDEIGTDCGGVDCAACVENAAPCTNPNNKVYLFLGPVAQLKSVTSTEVTENSGTWTYTAYTGGGTINYLRLIFSSKPNVSTTYTGVTGTSFIESNEVDIVYSDVSNGDRIGSGSVYVTYTSGVYNMSSCDYSFHEWGQTTPSSTQWFNVSFN